MADNMEKIWSINELMKRYAINRASMTEYAKAKIDIINKDGIHAKKAGKEWQFDAEAVRILDELRNYGIAMENYDSPEKMEIERLKAELLNAEKYVLNAQEENRKCLLEISALKDEIIRHIEARQENMLLLNNAQSDIAIIQKTRELENEAASSEIERQQAEIEGLKEERATDKSAIEMLQRKLHATEVALSIEKNKTIWERIFGN